MQKLLISKEYIMSIPSQINKVILMLIISGIFWSSGLAQRDANGGSYEIEIREISFYTSDSINIFGDLYIADPDLPIILLFHQGGSNARGEYKSIIPELVKEPFNILAIDQRRGGQYFGSYNRTLTQIEDHSYSNPYSYCDAYNNLEAALNFVIESGFKGKRILWGSSYSASLAIQLAAKRPRDVAGVLAFSPASGPPMEGCIPFEFLEGLPVPCLLLRPPNEMDSEQSKAQFGLATQYGHQTYVPEYGVHGSSMLVAERVGMEVSETWKVVRSFLSEVVSK